MTTIPRKAGMSVTKGISVRDHIGRPHKRHIGARPHWQTPQKAHRCAGTLADPTKGTSVRGHIGRPHKRHIGARAHWQTPRKAHRCAGTVGGPTKGCLVTPRDWLVEWQWFTSLVLARRSIETWAKLGSIFLEFVETTEEVLSDNSKKRLFCC